METVLELMNSVVPLIYDVNKIIENTNERIDPIFMDGAEMGIDVSKFDIADDRIKELYEKRKMVFHMNNKIVLEIDKLSSLDKDRLFLKIQEVCQNHSNRYQESLKAYNMLVERVTDPEFTFDGNEEYKEIIISLKDSFSRHKAAVNYYENMISYLKPQTRSK